MKTLLWCHSFVPAVKCCPKQSNITELLNIRLLPVITVPISFKIGLSWVKQQWNSMAVFKYEKHLRHFCMKKYRTVLGPNGPWNCHIFFHTEPFSAFIHYRCHKHVPHRTRIYTYMFLLNMTSTNVLKKLNWEWEFNFKRIKPSICMLTQAVWYFITQ